MCDEHTADDNDRAGPSRRDVGIALGAGALSLLLPSPADALPVAGRSVSITTPDGTADAYFVAPASGRHPGVLVWPDVMGLRPVFEQMARRLAESGYAVLVVNQFYRSTRAPFLQAGESFDQPAVRDRIMPWRALLTPAATTSDARAFTAWLDRQKEVDPRRPLGTAGYCMGGPMTIRTAAALPGRYRAGASFHGAGLVGPAPDGPDKLVGRLKGGYLLAIARNDDARSPQDKDTLRAAFAAAHVPAEVEVYPADHGWCVPDGRAYDRAAAERAWSRQLALFSTRLGGRA